MRARIVVAAILLIAAACGATGGPSGQAPSATPTAAPSPSPAASPSPRPTERVLSIPLHYQEHKLSCEAAALVMALSHEGISVDELTLIGFMTRDPRPAVLDAAGNVVTWGDPSRSFVGDPDGSLQLHTGYGVYAHPVATAAATAGGKVLRAGGGLYGTPVPAADVYNAILDGHPVIAWISNTYHTQPLLKYTSFDGAPVSYNLTEHAVTLVGVRSGSVLVNDPWFGQQWRSMAEFEAGYATFEQMAVILA